MIKRPFLICLPLVFGLMALSLRAPAEAQNEANGTLLGEFLAGSQPVDIRDDESEIQKLLKQRFNVAVEEFSDRLTAYQTGESTSLELFESAIRLKEAELALADSTEKRIEILQRNVKAMDAFESAVESLVNSGLREGADLLRLRYERLTCQIELEQAKSR